MTIDSSSRSLISTNSSFHQTKIGNTHILCANLALSFKAMLKAGLKMRFNRSVNRRLKFLGYIDKSCMSIVENAKIPVWGMVWSPCHTKEHLHRHPRLESVWSASRFSHSCLHVVSATSVAAMSAPLDWYCNGFQRKIWWSPKSSQALVTGWLRSVVLSLMSIGDTKIARLVCQCLLDWKSIQVARHPWRGLVHKAASWTDELLWRTNLLAEGNLC